MTTYRAPNESSSEFIDYLNNKLKKFKNLLLITDTNFDLLKDATVNNEYTDMLASNGHTILNTIDFTHSTRSTDNSFSIIDHVISDLIPKYKFKIQVEDCSFSDHRALFIEIDASDLSYNKANNITIRKFDKEMFRNEVLSQMNKSSKELGLKQMIELINQAKTKSTKIVTKKVKFKRNWINIEILKSINSRDIIYKKMKKCPENANLRNEFKRLRNKVRNLIISAKREYISNKILNAGKDGKKLWGVINNDILQKVNKSSKTNINCIIDENGVVHSQAIEIANAFNKFFNDVGEKLRMNINDSPPIRMIPSKNTIYLEPITEQEVKLTIQNLKQKAAPGIDGVMAEDLSLILDIISTPLTRIFNESVENGKYPVLLKKTVVVPLHKAGDRKMINNYRPIALLSVVGKVFEKCLDRRIRRFIESNVGFDKNQFGFQEHSGTESAVTEVVSKILEFIDEKKFVGTVFIDLQKAFDTVDHKLLLDYLSDLGLRGKCSELIESYLSQREVVTKIGEVYSESLIIKTGVPQGSVLGPLFYILYINSIRYADIRGDYTIFADDTSLTYSAANELELQSKMNEDLLRFKNWVDSSKLSLNKSKTKYMIFKPKNKLNINPNIKIDNMSITRTDMIKYLGVTIDEKLNWNKHVSNMLKKLWPIIIAINRSGEIEKKAAKLIYNAHILSHIRYLCSIWSHTAKYNVNRVQRFMNAAIRVLYKQHRFTSTEKLYKSTDNLKIKNVIFIERMKFIHRISQSTIKTNIVLSKNNEFHNYPTRGAENYRPKLAKSEKCRTSLLRLGIIEYNSLPNELKKYKSVHLFAKKLVSLVRNENL